MAMIRQAGRRAALITTLMGWWLSLLGLGGAWAQIYKWTDRQGVVHFTDNPARIPAPYRSGVAVEPALSTPGAAELDKAQTPPSEGTPPSVGTPITQSRDRLGRGPDYWQALAEHWSTQLQQSMQERERLQLLARYTRQLANGTRDMWDRARLESEASRLEMALAEVEGQIKEADTMLQTTLPLEAMRFGADPDWLKPPAVKPP